MLINKFLLCIRTIEIQSRMRRFFYKLGNPQIQFLTCFELVGIWGLSFFFFILKIYIIIIRMSHFTTWPTFISKLSVHQECKSTNILINKIYVHIHTLGIRRTCENSIIDDYNYNFFCNDAINVNVRVHTFLYYRNPL